MPLAIADRISLDVVPESLQVFADRQLVEQVLINLVKNAGEAAAETIDAHIAISGKLELGRVIISVSDNGAGIHEDDLDQIFIPFFTTKREGSGIGLSLSRQIMTAHNGDIAVSSDSSGTSFRLVFS